MQTMSGETQGSRTEIEGKGYKARIWEGKVRILFRDGQREFVELLRGTEEESGREQLWISIIPFLGKSSSRWKEFLNFVNTFLPIRKVRDSVTLVYERDEEGLYQLTEDSDGELIEKDGQPESVGIDMRGGMGEENVRYTLPVTIDADSLIEQVNTEQDVTPMLELLGRKVTNYSLRNP